jgi:hypothetical protein
VLFQILGGVEIFHVARGDVELEVGAVVLVVLVVGDLIRHGLTKDHTRLVGPAASHVADGVPTTTKNEEGKVELFDKVDTIAMALEREIETAQTVTRQRISPTLKDNGSRLVHLYGLLDNRLEDTLEALIIHTIHEGEVERVVPALANTDVFDASGAGEVFTKLVEGDGHDAVGCVEGLFDTVTMVDIDINVKHTCMVLEQLENGEHDIVDVAKTGSLTLLGVVKTTSPVDTDICCTTVELVSTTYGTTSGKLTESKEAVENGAVDVSIVPLKFSLVE